MTVKQLLESVDSRELSEWMVMGDLEQWKERIAEKQRAQPLTGGELFSKLFQGAKRK